MKKKVQWCPSCEKIIEQEKGYAKPLYCGHCGTFLATKEYDDGD